jgi:hypothetical protein
MVFRQSDVIFENRFTCGFGMFLLFLWHFGAFIGLEDTSQIQRVFIPKGLFAGVSPAPEKL